MTEEQPNDDLAELLAEVRSLRREFDELAKAVPSLRREPGYAVLAVSESALDPEYAVLVRAFDDRLPGFPTLREPSYAVLVRQDLSRDLPPEAH